MAASGVRSSWLASAANERSRRSLASRRASADSTWPEHPVEGRAELTDLGPRIGVGHPLRQAHLAAGQRQLGDPGRGGRHPAQRPQRRPHPGGADHAGDQQRRQEHRDLGQGDLLQRVGDVGQRQPGHDPVAVPACGWRSSGSRPATTGRRSPSRRRPAPRRSRAWSAAVRWHAAGLLRGAGEVGVLDVAVLGDRWRVNTADACCSAQVGPAGGRRHPVAGGRAAGRRAAAARTGRRIARRWRRSARCRAGRAGRCADACR